MTAAPRLNVQARGLTVAYAETGAGPPVVYLHGALMTADEGLIGLGPVLSERFRLIAFDRPGHGGSDRDLTTGSAWRQAQVLAEALRALSVQRPVVIGHSFGGAVAMALALRFPDALAGVVALSPIAVAEPRLEHLLFGWRAAPGIGEGLSILTEPLDAVLLPALWGGLFAPQTMPAGFAAAFPFDLAARPAELTANGQEAAVMAADLMRSLASYWTCRVPVRVLLGERDAAVNPMHGRVLTAACPRASLRMLPGLGHMAHHFAPDAVREAVQAVLAQRRDLSR